jgi:tetratricopeptide (TPR) repeat protein
VRDWIRAERGRPAPYRYAARIYEDMGALSQAVDAAAREAEIAPTDASAWERLGRLRLRIFDRAGAREALERAREAGPTEQGLLDLALVANLLGDVGAEVTACEQATRLAPESETAWARYAHALARTDRITDCLEACDRALALADDPEVRDLRDHVARMAPRELRAA